MADKNPTTSTNPSEVQSVHRSASGGGTAVAYTYAAVASSALAGIDAARDPFGTGIWTLMNATGTAMPLRPFRVGSGGFWASGTLASTLAGISPCIIALPDGSFRLAYIDGANAVTSRYRVGVGETNVQTIGAGTLVDAIMDADGRLVCAVYDTAWKIRIGALDAGGTTFTFSSAVSMGLTADEAKGKILQLPDRSYLFFYVVSGSATVARCRGLSGTGAGGWV